MVKFRILEFVMYLRNRSTLLATTLIITAPFSSAIHAAAAPPPDSHLEEIIISGAYDGKKLGQTILGTTILNREDIHRQLDGSIGETLRRQPGISSTFFGPGASRPIIRGLGGDRIRVLDNGIGSIDASSTSPDHATAVEPALAERIEILRGTAMLMYGSSAAGGVVNVIDSRIPSKMPEEGLEAALRYGHTTVNGGNELTGAFNTELGQLGDTTVLFHADGMYRQTEDFSIPGYAESEKLRALEEANSPLQNETEHAEEAFGTVENSATKSRGGSAGLSVLFPSGFLGFNLKFYNSDYGVPSGHVQSPDQNTGGVVDTAVEEEENVTIDLNQVRFDVNGEYKSDWLLFKKAKFRFGYADYKHTELEGDNIGTSFLNKGWESRLDFTEKGGENWNGATGIHVKSRNFSAIGDEAFVPPTKSKQYGLYTVKELTLGGWHIDAGARFEYTDYNLDVPQTGKSFTGFSASLGVGYDLSDVAFWGVTVSRTERAPSTEELFSNGPHLATNAFEQGNSNLGLETALGLETTFSYATPEISFVLNGFITSYDDFIYEADIGAQEDGLEVFEFTAHDAKLYGFEGKLEVHAGSISSLRFGDLDLHFDAQVDLVRAELSREEDKNLPRIPPLSALLGAEIRSDLFDIRTEVEYAGAQTRVTQYEIPTDDYFLVNAYVTIRPFNDERITLEIRGTNLGNKDARQHTSFLKDRVPLPGRNLKLSIGVQF